MYAHSVQGLNRRTASYLAAPECGEKTSWWGCSARNEVDGLLHLPALTSWGMPVVTMCVASSWLSELDFNLAHNCCDTKKARALKSGRHTENETRSREVTQGLICRPHQGHVSDCPHMSKQLMCSPHKYQVLLSPLHNKICVTRLLERTVLK